LSASRFVAVVIGPNFSDSRWAGDEMKPALARERRERTTVVIPILAADAPMPAFLEDKLYIDLRNNYHAGLARLAPILHVIPRQQSRDAIRSVRHGSIRACIGTLRFAGCEPYVVMSVEDAEVILRSGGQRYTDQKLRFSPEQGARNPAASPGLRRMMQ